MSYEAPQQVLRWANLPECESPAEGWRVQRFTDIAKVIAGQSPPSETYNEKGDGLPFLQGNADFSFKHPIPKLWCNSPAKIAKTGDTLISVRAPVGEINRADQDYAIGRGLAAIRATSANLDFIYQALQRWRRSLQRVAQGTTFDAVTARHFSQLRVAIPENTNEQAAIARILDAVDTAIERTREAVERTEVLKLALMQAAFSFEMTNESYKSSDAGHIPESWQAINGKQAFTVLSGGNSSVFALKPLREEVEADAWFMKVDDFNLPENSRRIVKTQIGFRATDNLDFRLVPIDTLVIAKRGAAILKNRVRTTAVPVALDPNLMGLQMQAEIIPEFFRYQLEWRNLSRYIESSGVPQLNNKDLYPRWFFKPPEDQQKEIVSVIAATETYQDALLRKLNVIEQLKKSLMHDLLTGKVRVGDLSLTQEKQARESMTQRPIGLAKAVFQVPASFFEPLPDEILDAFEGNP